MAKDIALVKNPANGKFNFKWAAGDVVFDETWEHEVVSRLVEARAKWWADEDGTHGSRLRDIKSINSSTKSDAEAYAREALKPMEDARKIVVKRVAVSVLQPTQGSRFSVAVFYSVAGSKQVLQATTTFV